MSAFQRASSLPATRNAVLGPVSRWLLAHFGWRADGVLPDEPRLVLIVAPHTSNWDFPLGLLVKWALGIRVSFFAKDTLFPPLLGWFMRRWGGIPVDRSSANNVVAQMVDEFRQQEKLLLVIAPEGTRKHVAEWKTGFYHIAFGAHVPIVCVAFDWGRHVIRFGPMMHPTGDAQRDVAKLRAAYDDVRGKRTV